MISHKFALLLVLSAGIGTLNVHERMRRPIAYIIIGVLLLAACGPSHEEQKRRSYLQYLQEKREDSLALKVGVTPTMDCLPLFVALDDSLFRREGIDVRLKMRQAQMDNDTAFAGGSVEGMASDLVRTERLRRLGTPVRYVAATNACWQLVTNPKARLKERSQLGDKMVAMTRWSATDWLTDVALKGVKTTAMVYRVQINDVGVRLRMMLNNEMDALWLPEPQATEARLFGAPVLYDTRKHDIRLGVVAFREQSLADGRRQKQLRGFLKAYDMAVDSINKHGVGHYAGIISKYCGCSGKAIRALPRLEYAHAAPPRAQDVARANTKKE